MVLSRGLVISLGVSALGCTLLFLYFRNKITAVEKKVDIMFDLIQNHQKQQNQQQMNMRENMHMNTEQEFEETDNMVSQEEISGWTENVKSDKELIQVSDDDDEEEDDDSEEVSDSDSEDEEDEIPKLSLAKTEDMTLEINDVKKIVVQEATKAIKTELNEPEDVTDSLDEIDVDEDEDEDEEDDEDEDNGMGQGDEEVVVAKLDEEFDYNKLKVSELKSLAAAKKLEGYKSLKKGPLIELLKSSE